MAAHATSAAAVSPAARLFQEYGEQLYRFCLGRMGSREEAEDAVQSTFLRAHKALERGVVPEYEAAWLYKIAHNVCLTRRGVLARTGRTIPLYDRDDIEVAVAAPEGRRDELLGLPDALASLTPNLRQAILLREWQGLSYAEIAQAMGTTVSAVETLIFRARRELAAALSAERPKRRRAKLFDLLAALFGPKLAAGAALLALGGAGIGTAFELQRQGPQAPAPPQPAQIGAAISAPGAARSVARPVAGVQQPRAGRASVVLSHASAPAPTVAQAVTPASGRTPPAATAQPAAQPAAPAPAPAPVPAATAPATTAATLTTAAQTLTTAAQALPTVEAPTLTLPTVDVPTVQVPTVSVPQLPVGPGH